MRRLTRHGGGSEPTQQFRRPGQGFGSQPGANGPAGWQPQFRNDLRNAAGGGGSVTQAIQAERARQGLPNTAVFQGGMANMGPDFTRISQSMQSQMAGPQSQPGQGKGPSPYFQGQPQRRSVQQPNYLNGK